MALINIEYGSVARSDVLNKNFLYLDEKIADTNNSNATSISSILSDKQITPKKIISIYNIHWKGRI